MSRIHSRQIFFRARACIVCDQSMDREHQSEITASQNGTNGAYDLESSFAPFSALILEEYASDSELIYYRFCKKSTTFMAAIILEHERQKRERGSNDRKDRRTETEYEGLFFWFSWSCHPLSCRETCTHTHLPSLDFQLHARPAALPLFLIAAILLLYSGRPLISRLTQNTRP